jgi:signal transduction histidine kinase
MGRTLHRVAWELRPAAIDDLGVTAALANYTSEWSSRSGIEVDLHRTDRSLCGVPDEVRTTVFRVVQEALTNVVKHAAGATAVSIVIDRTDALLQLTIEDNGQGFDPAAIETGALRGLGLAGMRERLSLIQGELAIESSAGVGTSIFVRIKLPGSKAIA